LIAYFKDTSICRLYITTDVYIYTSQETWICRKHNS